MMKKMMLIALVMVATMQYAQAGENPFKGVSNRDLEERQISLQFDIANSKRQRDRLEMQKESAEDEIYSAMQKGSSIAVYGKTQEERDEGLRLMSDEVDRLKQEIVRLNEEIADLNEEISGFKRAYRRVRREQIQRRRMR